MSTVPVSLALRTAPCHLRAGEVRRFPTALLMGALAVLDCLALILLLLQVNVRDILQGLCLGLSVKESSLFYAFSL